MFSCAFQLGHAKLERHSMRVLSSSLEPVVMYERIEGQLMCACERGRRKTAGLGVCRFLESSDYRQADVGYIGLGLRVAVP